MPDDGTVFANTRNIAVDVLRGEKNRTHEMIGEVAIKAVQATTLFAAGVSIDVEMLTAELLHLFSVRAGDVSILDEKSRAGTPAQIKAWERANPLAQKFTKTDLSKYEHSWEEEPHLVSRGAEKNFAHWTATREDNGWPIVDEQYFRRLVAKAILFRRTEEIASAQEYPGYRANIVILSIAWLCRRSAKRINLDEIWKHQSIPSKLVGALDAVAHAARKHIINPPGGRNITDWCKKEECWSAFRD